MYQRILLAYDGNEDGIVALREGALLARRFDAQVFLLSVLPEQQGLMPLASGMTVNSGPFASVVRTQMASYTAVLDRGMAALKKLGLTPVGKLVIGEPAPEIGAYAREVGADLVVVGHHHQSLLQRWWSGGTGAYLGDHVDCSVLISRKLIGDDEFARELKTASERSEDRDAEEP
jgi:nucleotide-binding universal stress UspA family protein